MQLCVCVHIPVCEYEGETCSVVSDSLWPHGLYSPWNFPGQNTGVGSLSLLQGIIPTQGSTPGHPHCRRILYHLSYQGSPGILEWVAYPFSNRSSWPRTLTRVSCIARGFFTSEPPGKPRNTGVGSLSLLQQIVLTQKSNWCLVHCKRIFLPAELPGLE